MNTKHALLDYADAFSARLLDPSADVPEDVALATGHSAASRFNVYRNNVTVSLIDAVASIYPAVQRITGIEFFRAMARFYVRAKPPASPLLFEYGRDFPEFIASYEYAVDMPWLADTARIERAWLDAYHAADAAPLGAAEFGAIEPEMLASVHLTPHPATHVLRSRYPAVSIFAMNRVDDPSSSVHSSTPEDALITRPEHDVIVSNLSSGGAVFVTSLMNGQSLGAAVEAAFDDTPSFDLQANLAGVISAGAFTHIHFET